MIKIKFTKLFDIFNYDIILCENGMSIITGPNGFGKSTIIKSIKTYILYTIWYCYLL